MPEHDSHGETRANSRWELAPSQERVLAPRAGPAPEIELPGGCRMLAWMALGRGLGSWDLGFFFSYFPFPCSGRTGRVLGRGASGGIGVERERNFC